MKITEKFELHTELRQCPSCGRSFRVGADSPTVYDSRFCRELHKVERQPPIRISEPQLYQGEARLEPYTNLKFRARKFAVFY